eukprot:4144829-Lingulodinium_polyedra.AAC.1
MGSNGRNQKCSKPRLRNHSDSEIIRTGSSECKFRSVSGVFLDYWAAAMPRFANAGVKRRSNTAARACTLQSVTSSERISSFQDISLPQKD